MHTRAIMHIDVNRIEVSWRTPPSEISLASARSNFAKSGFGHTPVAQDYPGDWRLAPATIFRRRGWNAQPCGSYLLLRYRLSLVSGIAIDITSASREAPCQSFVAGRAHHLVRIEAHHSAASFSFFAATKCDGIQRHNLAMISKAVMSQDNQTFEAAKSSQASH